MEREERTPAFEPFPMKGGDGPYSYTHNSSYQKSGVEGARTLIFEGIANKLDIKKLFVESSMKFNVADLGCSVGPNTFIAAENIIDSVKHKCKLIGLDPSILEFQVFFNDHTSNDFNMLFKSLPLNKPYYAAGMPGSFHSRLFPKASLHFIHCSYALQWLSQVPKEVLDKDSPSWNKGRIYYSIDAPNPVLDAYRSQFAKDIEVFLNARAIELVHGGLMAILLPSSSAGSGKGLLAFSEFVGSALMDMANLGLISEEKVDVFNLPIHNPTSEELEELIKRSGCFTIESVESLVVPLPHFLTAEAISLHLRAGFEGLLGQHFGYEIMDELFYRIKQKLAEWPFLSNLSSRKKPIKELFILLRRI